jgi:hypothetical protein
MRHSLENRATKISEIGGTKLIGGDLPAEPHASVSPFTFSGSEGNIQHLGNFLEGEPDKIAQLNDLGLPRIVERKAIQCFTDGQRFLLGSGRHGNFQIFNRDMFGAAPAFAAAFTAGAVNQHAPHRFGGSGKEMASVLPNRLSIRAEAEPGFVCEGGGLKSLARRLRGHFVRGNLLQLFINQRDEFVRGCCVPLLHAMEDVGEIANGLILTSAAQKVELASGKGVRLPGCFGVPFSSPI